MTYRTLILAAMLSSSALTIAQTPPAAPPIAREQRSSGETPTPQESAQKFVQEKRSEQARYIEELRSQGIAYGQVKSLVNKFRNTFKANKRATQAGLADEINDIFLEDVAIELAVLGFGPSDLRDDVQAKRLFDAAVNKRRGVATADDLTLLAQEVVVGRAVEIAFTNATGPSPAFLVLKVERVLKGALSPERLIRIPLSSSRVGDNLYERNSEETLPPLGSSVRAYLSQSASRFSDRKGRKFTEADVYQKIADLQIVN